MRTCRTSHLMDDVTCTRSNCSKQSQRLTPTTRNKSNKRLGASTGPSSRLPSERLKTPSESAGSGHAVCRPDRPQKASTRAWVWERLWERRLDLGANTYEVLVPLAPLMDMETPIEGSCARSTPLAPLGKGQFVKTLPVHQMSPARDGLAVPCNADLSSTAVARVMTCGPVPLFTHVPEEPTVQQGPVARAILSGTRRNFMP